MNIEKLTIENFKCFQSQVDIEFGKLTLLTGANSSGKSSIMYSILGAIQSGEFPFQFSTNGKYVNMGDFREVVYKHKRGNKIKIGFTFKNSNIQRIETIWEEDKRNNLPRLFKLSTTSDFFNLTVEVGEDKYRVNFAFDPDKDTASKNLPNNFFAKFADVADMVSLLTSDNADSSSQSTFTELVSELQNEQTLKDFPLDEVLLYNRQWNVRGTFALQIILESISREFNLFDENINFISSFRLHPERTYLEKTKFNLKIDSDGDKYLDQIIYWETKKDPKLKELLKILKDLQLLDSIKSKRLDGGRYEIAVKVKKNGVDTSLSDVGFGVSQFLPIIVADLQLPQSSTLFVAQPEIHLHPSVQSSFGDYLTKQIKENSKNYVIETHSEYLLNRIRLAIVKGEISEDDVKVIFVDNQSVDSIIHKISFTKKGQILNAPDNFFKTYMMDVMEIAINAAA